MCIRDRCEGYPKKPDPTMVFAIARKLGRKIEECVYIGDSEVDIRTGSAAGMRTIGVTSVSYTHLNPLHRRVRGAPGAIGDGRGERSHQGTGNKMCIRDRRYADHCTVDCKFL